MSDEEEVTVETSDGQILSAEYKDGQLQIVEVTPFEKERQETHILPDLGDGEDKYMQVIDTSKGLVQLDLLNLTLVRCQDGEESYQLVANAGTSDGEMSSDTATVTCVLQSSDNEDPDNQDSYVMVENENGENSLVILKSALQQATALQKKDEAKKSLSPAEILEKAKALQKAKALLQSTSRGRGRGRKRKSDLPPPHELLASPNFKLYLYNCKLCSFKCNAVKDMSAHKARSHGSGSGRGRAGGRGASVTLQCARCPFRAATHTQARSHGSGSGRGRAGGRGASVTLQCARCPFRAATHTQLIKHVQEKHMDGGASSKCRDYTVHLDTEEVEAADVLVCGACGFESGSRSVFRKHIEEEHGATTC